MDRRLHARVSAVLRRNPVATALVTMMILAVAVPALDIGVSSWFYAPERRIFPARIEDPYEWVRKEMPTYIFAVAIAVAVAWAAGEAAGRVFFGIGRRTGLFLLGSLALGPGLIVNVLFKDVWGRPRPTHIAEFAGSGTYVFPLVPSGQCDSNCSFPSGHAALAYWLVAFALLAPPRLRPWAVAAAVGFGSLVGLSRIAQGGHFLSDVVFAAFITIGVILWLHGRIFLPSGKNNESEPRDTP
ncbi:MAG: phosphatase PAP2 family protein [Magnetospirillum sp.]|nr:phosphatase PAP2 family protein [Magnetospirillum sp.]